MRFLIYTDVHFSEYSSIIRNQSYNYSYRLENLIKSINWAEQLAESQECDSVICLGDFFDKPDLNSRELTALQEINWAKLPHTFLVGNHEASISSLRYNSVTALQNNGFKIITEPILEHTDNCDILYIPYVVEDERKDLSDYWKSFDFDPTKSDNRKKFIMTHNDIKGINYGAFLSENGFDINDFANHCTLCFNGHIHNCGLFLDKHLINVGNLTGQNFNEDSTKYSHNVCIVDSIEGTFDLIENPYALNFYKFDMDESNISLLSNIKDNAIVSIHCSKDLRENIKRIVEDNDKIAVYRLTIKYDNLNKTEDAEILYSSDYISKFIAFCKDHIEDQEILDFELKEICK